MAHNIPDGGDDGAGSGSQGRARKRSLGAPPLFVPSNIDELVLKEYEKQKASEQPAPPPVSTPPAEEKTEKKAEETPVEKKASPLPPLPPLPPRMPPPAFSPAPAPRVPVREVSPVPPLAPEITPTVPSREEPHAAATVDIGGLFPDIHGSLHVLDSVEPSPLSGDGLRSVLPRVSPAAARAARELPRPNDETSEVDEVIEALRAKVAGSRNRTAKKEAEPISSTIDAPRVHEPKIEETAPAATEVPPPTPDPEILDLERKLTVLRNRYRDDEDILAILERVENGGLTTFDRHTVQLARAILASPDKVALSDWVLWFVKPVGRLGGAAVGGVAGFVTGALAGDWYATSYALSRLTEYAGPDKANIKALIDSIMDSIVKMKHALPSGGDLDLTAGALETARAWLTQANTEAMVAGSRAMQTADQIIQRAANTIGDLASYPAGAATLLLGAALAGGTVNLLKGRQERSSAERLMPFIRRSDEFIKARRPLERGEIDPRHELLGWLQRILKPDHAGFRFPVSDRHPISKPWMQFLAAAHRANASLLRELTHTEVREAKERIYLHPETEQGLEETYEVVEAVTRGQEGLIVLDQELLVSFLTQVNAALKGKLDAAEKHVAGYATSEESAMAQFEDFTSGAWYNPTNPFPYAVSMARVFKNVGFGTARQLVKTFFDPWRIVREPAQAARRTANRAIKKVKSIPIPWKKTS